MTHVIIVVAIASELFKIAKATLGLDKHLEISKELMRECVTVSGCCCCMPGSHCCIIIRWARANNYVRKNTLLATKGGCICTPLPLNPPLTYNWLAIF